MRIDCYLTPNDVDDLALRERTAVVIDVLRASTSIVTALGNGAKEVIPATTVESATKISANLGGDVALLAGERNGRMVPGFDLGNSPSEFTGGKIHGRSIIFTSTNGSQAIAKARYAQELAVCAFINMSAVVQLIVGRPRPFAVVCSGKEGGFSLEDTVCAGMLISRVAESLGDDVSLSDAAVAAVTLHKALGRGLLKMMKNSEHGRFLEEIGFGDDLKLCAQIDTVPVVPLLDAGVLRLKRAEARIELVTQSMNR
jgi:2-phosphosulfolactate phosphatase